MESRKENDVQSKIGSGVGSFGYRGTRETLSTRFDLLLTLGSGKGGAHHRLAEVGGVMHHGGWRKLYLMVKPGAKDAHGHNE
jgi:hypothetical protein